MGFRVVHSDQRSAARIAAADRARTALELRRNGLTLDSIAVELGVTRQRAGQLIDAALRNVVTTDAEAWRATEVIRLERLTEIVTTKVEEDLRERKEVNLRAVDRLIRISERRSKLLGLDMPTQVELKKDEGPKVVEVALWERPPQDVATTPDQTLPAPGEGVDESEASGVDGGGDRSGEDLAGAEVGPQEAL